MRVPRGSSWHDEVVDPLLRRAVASLAGPARDVTVAGRAVVGYDAFQAGRQVARISGTAVVDRAPREWSLVEKTTAPPGVASPYLRSLAERELAAYASEEVTHAVPGLTAPRLHAHQVGADGTITLLLEDVGPDRRWSPDDVLVAARHLGRLAGRWLGEVPAYPWLFQGWARHHSQLPALDAGRRLVRGHLASPPPELHDVTYADARVLLDTQERIHRSLDRLPQTLCHHDAARSNLFARRGHDGPETVAIDWELVGPGAVGADLASLLLASVRRGDLSVDVLAELVEPAVDGYVAGMADLRRPVPRAQVRAGLRLATCLRWTLLRDVLVSASQGDHAFHRGTARDEPPAEARRQLMSLTRHLLREADDGPW